MNSPPRATTPDSMSVPIGRWAVAAAPVRLKTLLGSCAGLALHDRAARIGGLAHIVLPDSRGATNHPGKFADTAIPALLNEMSRLSGSASKARLCAKILGGASMFASGTSLDIGRMNLEAVETILARLGIPVLARDVGGGSGRHLTFDPATGLVAVRIPGGADYTI